MSKVVPMHGFGGGGALLNFKVVGNPQPVNPPQNTIWLNTDRKITGYYFTPTQPEKMVEGDVWFGVGTSGPTPFNALKKDTIMIFPNSAKQYVSGALVDVASKIYQNGKWTDLKPVFKIFEEGVGLKSGYSIAHKEGENNGSNSANGIIWSTNAYHGGGFTVEPKVDVTKYSTIMFEFQCDDYQGTKGISYGIGTNPVPNYFEPGDFTAKGLIERTCARTKYSVDISTISGEFYIKFFGHCASGTVFNIWLE